MENNIVDHDGVVNNVVIIVVYANYSHIFFLKMLIFSKVKPVKKSSLLQTDHNLCLSKTLSV